MNDDNRNGYLEAYKTFVVNYRCTLQSEERYVTTPDVGAVLWTHQLTINGVKIEDLFDLDQFSGDNS